MSQAGDGFVLLSLALVACALAFWCGAIGTERTEKKKVLEACEEHCLPFAVAEPVPCTCMEAK